MNAMNDSMIFLPFILILAPLPLVGIGRLFFKQYYKIEKRMDKFYHMLLQESLDYNREDVEAIEKDNLKDCHEILQMFRDSNDVYAALLTRSVIQLVVGGLICLLTTWIFQYGLCQSNISCEVFSKHYVCVVPLANFYWYIVLTATICITGYVTLVIYNLMWLMCKNISPFYEFMNETYEHINNALPLEANGHLPKRYSLCLPMVDSADPFFDLYMDHAAYGRDLGLLITLLATKNGVSEGLRILSFFDKEYQRLWKPTNVSVTRDEQEKSSVCVGWDDAPIASFIHNYRGRTKKMRIEYTVEFIPNSEVEVPLKNQVFCADDACYLLANQQCNLWQNDEKHRNTLVSRTKYCDTFYKTTDCTEHSENSKSFMKQESKENPGDSSSTGRKSKIIISTEVNGRTISQRTECIPTLAE